MALVGILASLAAPSMSGYVARTRVDSLTGRLAGDLHYTRMLAVRSGQRMELAFVRGADGCITRYQIRAEADPARVAKTVDVARDLPRGCLQANGTGSRVVFDSRGLLRTGRTFTASAGAVQGCVTLSSIGRIRRSC